MPPLVQKVNVSLEQAGFCYRQFPLLMGGTFLACRGYEWIQLSQLGLTRWPQGRKVPSSTRGSIRESAIMAYTSACRFSGPP